MDSTTQKLIHTFGSRADLGQEVAASGGFDEMVRTSLHLLLGTLAIRRGAVREGDAHTEALDTRAVWGMGDDFHPPMVPGVTDQEAFLNSSTLALIRAKTAGKAFSG